jgi:CRP-like cAMP-binding protein
MDEHKLSQLPLFAFLGKRELRDIAALTDENVAELGPSDFLGEIAALEMGHRTATVVARTPMKVVVMTARDLRHIAREMPEVDAQLREAARERCPIAS